MPIDPNQSIRTNAKAREAADAITKRQPSAYDASAEKRDAVGHLVTAREKLRDAMAFLTNAGACVMPDAERRALEANRTTVLAAIGGVEAHLARLGWLA